MQKLLPALLAILFLAGCAPTSVEPNAETATDNFERNLECQKLREEVSEYFDTDGIFYSPKVNSCVFSVEWEAHSKEGLVIKCQITDAFTKKAHAFESGYDNCNRLVQEYQN